MLKNIDLVNTPLHALHKRMDHKIIIQNQRIQFIDIFQKCLQNKHFQYTHEKETYYLRNGALYIQKEKDHAKLDDPKKYAQPSSSIQSFLLNAWRTK